jgi:hypothetical protein
MSHKSKKAAPEAISKESVTTKSAEAQEQPTTTPDGSTVGDVSAVRGAEELTTEAQSITVTKKNMSPEEEQFHKAIAMSDKDLGIAIKKPTQRITKQVGDALAHEEEAKKLRREAQQEFERNIAYYYEAKQRLRNPGYRTDVNGKNRTPEDNEKNFGAPHWEAYNERCRAYSLQHADRKLKAFAKAQGLLTDDGDNIDDVETEDTEREDRPEPRRTEDPTAQKRYEHIATAAMSLASENPEDEVSKQILAAAEHQPAPLMPVPPDVYTEVLSFITKIASSVNDEKIKAEAKGLLGKMLLHRPAPDPAEVLDAAQEEEKRKRGKRLARKNGAALGSATYNPPTNGTAEHAEGSMQTKQAAIPVTTAKRFWWTERKMGDLTELVIMDGKKVYDFYRPDEIQEMQAVIEKLNAEAEAGTQGTAMAAD